MSEQLHHRINVPIVHSARRRFPVANHDPHLAHVVLDELEFERLFPICPLN